MKTTLVALALAASTMASPMPQATTPESCSDSHSGTFQVTVVNVTSSAKRDVEKRQLAGVLTLSLEGGILKDQAGRTGYIASNYQWQFDNPPQENAISTSGYSYCQNNTLALAGSAIFYQCWSGDFYNLYDRHWAAQCSPIYLVAINGESGAPPASQVSDGQPQASTVIPITQITDGQPQIPTAVPISQISDGQPQVPTGYPVSQISDGQPQAPTGIPVSQISDGQPQAPTAAPPVVSQISDGQPQAPTAAPPVVSQISDGQPQAPTAAPPVVSQISDGQPQAPSAAPPVISQISDGQPQAPPVTPAPAPSAPPVISQISDGQPQAPAPVTSAPYPVVTSGVPVSQISDGQPQATGSGNYTIQTSVPAEFTGAAATAAYGVGAFAAGLMGVVAML